MKFDEKVNCLIFGYWIFEVWWDKRVVSFIVLEMWVFEVVGFYRD